MYILKKTQRHVGNVHGQCRCLKENGLVAPLHGIMEHLIRTFHTVGEDAQRVEAFASMTFTACCGKLQGQMAILRTSHPHNCVERGEFHYLEPTKSAKDVEDQGESLLSLGPRMETNSE